MKSERILEALGQVDEDLLALCDNFVPVQHHPWRWVSVAACFVLAVLTPILATHHKPLPASPTSTTAVTTPALSGESETQPDLLTTVPEVYEDIPQEQTQIHLPMQPYLGTTESDTTGKYHSADQDGAPPKGEAETAWDATVFDKAPLPTKYPTLLFDGQHYTSRGLSKPVFLQQLKTIATLTGFDGVHTTDVELYLLQGISMDVAVGVRFPETNERYAYVNTDYLPKTLGQFLDDLQFSENAAISHVYFTIYEYNKPSVTEFQKLMNRSATCTGGEVSPGKDVLYFDVDIPALGYQHCLFGLTSDGYLYTYLLESPKKFYVGKDRVDAFVKAAGTPMNKQVAVETTVVGTTKVSEPFMPQQWNVIECH